MSAQICPVCDMEWPTEPLACICGYSFEHRDPARAVELIGGRLGRADRMIAGGALSIASVPIGIALGLPGVVLVLSFPIQVVFGTSLLLAGVRSRMRERGLLRAARRLRQLPSARIVR